MLKYASGSVEPSWQWRCCKLIANSNVETEMGYVLEKWEEVNHRSFYVFVQTADTGETLDVGLLYSENTNGGDANGFLSAVSIATAGWVRPTLTIAQSESYVAYATTNTYGAYFLGGVDGTQGTGVTNAGSQVFKNHIGDGTQKTMSYTCSDGTDVFVGFLYFQTRFLPDLGEFLT